MTDVLDWKVSRYQILEKIGEGGMSNVYRANDTHLNSEVAVKVIRTELFPPIHLKNIMIRFKREAQALARLDHFNIVRVNDYGEEDGLPYLVMEYLPGGTLRNRIGDPIHYKSAVDILVPIARSLEYAHDEDFIHRDIKPANILFSKRGVPKLSDFGIVKMLGLDEAATVTSTGMGMGTPAYMAPEQWAGKTSPAVDVYALGVVFYELLTGKQPYEAETPAELYAQVITQPLPDPRSIIPDLPDSVITLLHSTLAKNANERCPNMSELISRFIELNDVHTETFNTTVTQQNSEDHETIVLSGSLESVSNAKGEDSQSSIGEMPEPLQVVIQDDSDSKAIHIGEDQEIVKLDVGGKDKSNKPLSPPFLNNLMRPKFYLAGGVFLITLMVWIAATRNGGISTVEDPEPVSAAVPTLEVVVTPTDTATPAPAKDFMVQVFVPNGEFTMGGSRFFSEQPKHKIRLSSYYIDRTEVTNEMYAKCVQANVCNPPANLSSKTREDYFLNKEFANYPVVFVSWEDAQKYCTWVGRTLPTEAQWEKAARGVDESDYVVNYSCETANYAGCVGDTTEVGSYSAAASAFGAVDMIGNVWEWVADYFADDYYLSYHADDWPENPTGPDTGKKKVLRGGSWQNWAITSSFRLNQPVDFRSNTIGFRCASNP
jgi:eukaryotic-like serine/threonine-protein kinase